MIQYPDAGGGESIELPRLSDRQLKAAGKIAELFSAVEEQDLWDSLLGELDGSRSSGSEEVSGEFFALLGTTREEAEQLFRDMRPENSST